MLDPQEDEIQAQFAALDEQNLRAFADIFPEFRNIGINDVPIFRRLVAYTLFFAKGAFEDDDWLEARIGALKKLCADLLHHETDGSELFERLDTFGKGKRGLANKGKFLESFKLFLVGKLNTLLLQSMEKKISFEEFRELFPVFKLVDTEANKSKITDLMHLINQFQSIPNKMLHRYKSMWLIAQIGELVKILLPVRVQGGNVTLLENVISNHNNALTEFQQYRLFWSARNIAADFFQVQYANDTEDSLERCSELCDGRVVPHEIFRLIGKLTPLARGENIVRRIAEAQDKPEVKIKMFAQMGYFLDKAKRFYEQGEEHLEETCMALLAASTCARAIMISKIAGPLRLESLSQIDNLRGTFAHKHIVSKRDIGFCATIAATVKQIDNLIALCEADAGRLSLDVRVRDYIRENKPDEGTESPRMFKK